MLDSFSKSGAENQSRTGDLLITNQLLYQLSYPGTEIILPEWGRLLHDVEGMHLHAPPPEKIDQYPADGFFAAGFVSGFASALPFLNDLT